MPTSLVALEILLILLPGFAAAYVVQLLALRQSQTDFDKVIEACLYSFVIYAIFMLCTGGVLPFSVTPAKPPSTDFLVTWSLRELVWLCVISVLVALGAATYFNRDGNWLFRKLRLTERTARRSIWNDVLQIEVKDAQVVQVELSDKRSLIGILRYYSDAAEDCSVYLTHASWVKEDGGTVAIPGPGILLTKNSNIQNISLLDD